MNCQCIRMPRPRRTKHARSPSASHSATGSPTSIGTISDAPRRRPSHRHRRKRSPSEHSSQSTVEPRRACAFARSDTETAAEAATQRWWWRWHRDCGGGGTEMVVAAAQRRRPQWHARRGWWQWHVEGGWMAWAAHQRGREAGWGGEVRTVGGRRRRHVDGVRGCAG